MTATSSHPLDSNYGGAAFALVTLASGCSAAWLSLAYLQPVPPIANVPSLYPPLWIFWAVWFLIYPAWGVATWLVWRKRKTADVRAALALYALTLVGNMFFMPIMSLSRGNLAIMSLLDANGCLSSWVLYWVYTRYEPKAKYFLLPLVAWMPWTLILKLWAWRLNS